FVILGVADEDMLDAQAARFEEFIEAIAGLVLLRDALGGIEEVLGMHRTHGRFEERFSLENDAVLLVQSAGAELVNDEVRIDHAIKNRNVEVDEETIGGLDMGRVLIANKLVRILDGLALGMERHRANGFRKDDEF